MTNSGSSPEPPKEGLKSLIVKGTIGAVALAGTTAIPIFIKQSLEKPAPVISPSVPAAVSSPSQPASGNPSIPATVSSPNQPVTSTPTPSSSVQIQPAAEDAATVQADEKGKDDPHGKPKGKKKGKKDD